ncbi:FYVE-domain-containing protein [Backusella circina FSU 941]|nr:FYVE-domain-containing protein [Backusella circina FSU 941]
MVGRHFTMHVQLDMSPWCNYLSFYRIRTSISNLHKVIHPLNVVNAASKGHTELVLFLLERGHANPLIKNKFGETAYDVAAAAGETYLCQLLESHESLTVDPLSFHVTIPVVLSQVQVGTDTTFEHDVWFYQNKSIPGRSKVALPNTEWFWLTAWTIDGTFPYTTEGGWSYARQGETDWCAEMPARPAGWVRRRCWTRIMKKRMDVLSNGFAEDDNTTTESEMEEEQASSNRLSTVSTTMAKATFINSSQSQPLLYEQIGEMPASSRRNSSSSSSSSSVGDEDEIQHMNGTWENNELALDCRQCHRVFNLIIRKHHCRRCGQVVCDKCSSHRALLPFSNSIHPPSISSQQVYLLSLQPQRVCDGCLDDMSPSSSGDMTECPVCNRRLREFKTVQEQEQHVQDCLRSSSNATSTSTRYIVYKLIPTSVLIGQECVICFEEFEADDTVTRLSCLCSFHRHCINHWFSKGKECPIHAQ